MAKRTTPKDPITLKLRTGFSATPQDYRALPYPLPVLLQPKRKKLIVFYGPPGTGKTIMSQELHNRALIMGLRVERYDDFGEVPTCHANDLRRQTWDDVMVIVVVNTSLPPAKLIALADDVVCTSVDHPPRLRRLDRKEVC